MKSRIWVLLFGVVFLAAPGLSRAETMVFAPGENWCSAANSAEPGTTILLEPGEHDRCRLNSARGTAGSPIVIGSLDPADPAYITTSVTQNLINLEGDASHIVLQDLYFPSPGSRTISAVKIVSGDDYTIQGCVFEGITNVAIAANSASSDGIVIKNNVFTDMQATAIYLGCHDGNCQVTNAVIESNLIDGVVSSGIGYGIQVKVNSYADIRHNSVFNTQGPGIMVYGSNISDQPPSLIDGNFVGTSRTSGNILVGGGPALVFNNIVFDAHTHGIHSYKHNAGGAKQGVVIAHNTILDSNGTCLHISSWTGPGNVAANNALLPTNNDISVGGEGLVVDNITCTNWEECVYAPNDVPFSVTPILGGPLADVFFLDEFESFARRDFMGIERGESPYAGALEPFEEDGGPWLESGKPRPGVEDENGDPDDEDPDDEDPDDGDPDDEDPDDGDPEEGKDGSGGCGCSSANPNGLPLYLFFSILLMFVLKKKKTLHAR